MNEQSSRQDEARGADFWEAKYASSDRVWSGHVNHTFVRAIEQLGVLQHTPDVTTLDLGCGEGADVLWLAGQGAQAYGVDISPTAVERAQQAAQTHPHTTAHFAVSHLQPWIDESDWPHRFNLITASFFPVDIVPAREDILAEAMRHLTPGGFLVLISHAAPPPWVKEHGHRPVLLTPEDEVKQLSLPSAQYRVHTAETVQREVQDPDGNPAVVEDSLVIVAREV